MPAGTLDLSGDRIIEQGGYWSLVLLYPGNVTAARFKGQIRRDYGGDRLADFQFGTPTYNPTTQKTTITAFLQGYQTESIPAPAEANQFWVYDIVMYADPNPNEPCKLLRGKVFVQAGVTDV